MSDLRAHVVVADDGERIVVTVYAPDQGAIVTVEMSPKAALRTAHDLTGASLRHIDRQERGG